MPQLPAFITVQSVGPKGHTWHQGLITLMPKNSGNEKITYKPSRVTGCSF